MKNGSQKFFDSIFRKKSMIDLLRWEVIPNAKEWTEIMAFHSAMINHLQLNQKDKDINIVIVGDGSTPRLGAYLATNSAWNCTSVDPQLTNGLWNGECQRLACYANKIQDVKLSFSTHTVVCFPHAHVAIDTAMRSITAPTVDIIANPCCSPLFIKGVPHHIEYDEKHMWSEKNLMKIWKGLTKYKCTSVPANLISQNTPKNQDGHSCDATMKSLDTICEASGECNME